MFRFLYAGRERASAVLRPSDAPRTNTAVFALRSVFAAVAVAIGLGAAAAPVFAQTAQTFDSGPFNQPSDIAFDSAGNAYVADTGNRRVIRIAAVGGARTTYGGGYAFPYGLAFDSAGNLYVADLGSSIKRVAAGNGAVTNVGSGFNGPESVAVDAAGNIYVADTGNQRIVRIDPTGTIQTVLAIGIVAPKKIALDSTRNIFVAQALESTILRIDGTTFQKTNVGSGFESPRGLAIDAAGNIFVSDYDSRSEANSRVAKIAPNGSVTTYVQGVRFYGLRFGPDGLLYGAQPLGNVVSRIVMTAAPVPTLSEWAMILFGMMLAGGAVVLVQRRAA